VILNKNILEESKNQILMVSNGRRTSNVKYAGLLKKRRSQFQANKNSIKSSERFLDDEKIDENIQIRNKSRVIINAKIGKQEYTIINGRTSTTIGKVGYAVTRHRVSLSRNIYIVTRINKL
jgi:hypothetical protein